MATDENSTKSPRVKIRWCRTVRCISKEVYLILSTSNETHISLSWKDELGWYESDFVSLPPGLHSGCLLIREKVQRYIFQPKLQEISTIKEREYKIDPFFVTNQRFCVELFIDSSRTTNGRTTDPVIAQQRFFSSQLLGSQSKDEKGVEKSAKKWSSSYELRNSPSDDYGESLKYVNDSNIKEKLKHDKQNEKCGKSSTEDIPFKLESNLRKCVSLDDKRKVSVKDSNSDSSYHSKSRSLYFEDDSRERSDFNFSVSNFLTGESSRYLAHEKTLSKEILNRSSSSQKTWSDAESSDVNSEIITNVRNILGTLKSNQEEKDRSKYFFKEFDPQEESNRGYGCLITFESCSSSMDDLGSPRALEEVLVSLTSSENESKYSGHFRNLKKASKEVAKDSSRLRAGLNSNQITNFAIGRASQRQSKESDVEGNSICELSETDKSESKYPESDITINEDENFQYDSLKHDDQTIPLNIREVIASEDSEDYSVNDSKESSSDHKDYKRSRNCKSVASKRNSRSGESSNGPFRETKSDGYDSNKSGLHNLKESRNYSNSAKGESVTTPLILVHPGSLRSETDNNGSGTYLVNTESDSTPSEIELFKAVNTVRKLSDSLKTFVKPIEPTSIEVQKLIPNKKTKIVIVRDRRPLTMSSGTQTSYRDSCPKVIEKSTRLRTRAQRDQKYSSFSSPSKVNSYTPLPNKVRGPWSSKNSNTSAEERFRQTILEKFKQNFRNLAKVENILKNINTGCDYVDNNSNSYYEEKTFSPHKFPPTQSAYNSFKESRPQNRGPTFSSRNSYPVYSKPSVTFQTQKSFNDSSDSMSERLQNSYISPTKLKKVTTPIFSIYGKEATRGYATQATNYRYTNPVLQSSLTSSTIRPANSLPDVRGSFEEDGSPTLIVSQKFRRRPQLKVSPSRNISESPYHSRRSFRSRSSEPNIYYQRELNSAGSTESLMEEAFRFSNSSNVRKDNEFKESVYKSPSIIRRGRTRSAGCVQTSLLSHRSESPNWISPMNSPRFEDSISTALRARSDTDLRMVGLLAGGYKGQQPYLPYSKRELSVGQVVKVLVPGEGVAMARIIYTPPDDKFLHSRYNDNISVLLISEPTNLSGSVINVPMNKILLAWPKTLLVK